MTFSSSILQIKTLGFMLSLPPVSNRTSPYLNCVSSSATNDSALSASTPSTTTADSSPSNSVPKAQMRGQSYSTTITFNPNATLQCTTNLVEKWINDYLNKSTIFWGKKFFKAVDRVVEANLILDENLQKLNQLLQKTPPTNVQENLEHQREIQQATHNFALSTTLLEERVIKAQDVKHEYKPFIINRDVTIENDIDTANADYLKPWKKTGIPMYRDFIAQIQAQNNLEINLLQAYAYVAAPWKEFDGFYDEIMKPQTSDEERAGLLQKLLTAKSSATRTASEVLPPIGNNARFPLTPGQRNEIQDIVSDVQRKQDSLFEDAAFYSKPISDNRQIIRDLRQEGDNPKYLHFSSLLTNKLLNDNQSDACLDFATEWMQNAQGDTPAENVLKMGSAFVTAASRRFQDDVTKGIILENPIDLHFYKYFNEWMKVHPEFHVSSDLLKAKKPIDDLNESEFLELLRGHLISLKGEVPTYEEMECYQNCDLISPSPHWKIKQGEFYVSVLEWDKTNRLIDDLPPERALHLKQMLSWSQYRAFCSVRDLATILFPLLARWSPEGKLKTALELGNVPVQIFSNPLIANSWIAKRTSYPDDLRNHPGFSSGITNPLDVFYLLRTTLTAFYPLIDRYRSIRDQEISNKWLKPSCGVITDGSMALFGGASILDQTIRFGWKWKITIPDAFSLIIQTGTSAVSIACLAKRTFHRRTSPGWRAAADISGSITSGLVPINLLYRSKDVIYSLGKRYIPTLTSGPFCMGANAIVIGYQVSKVGIEVGARLSPQKTSYFLMDAYEHFMSGEYEQAEALLKSAKDEWFIKEPLAANFLKCLDFFKLLPRLEADPNSKALLDASLENVDNFLGLLKDNTYYEPIRNALIVSKMGAYLKCEEKEKAQNVIRGEKPTLSLCTSVASFLITQAQSLISEKKHDKASAQLKAFSDVEQLKDYKLLLENYQKYIDEHKKIAEIMPDTPEDTIRLLAKLLDETISHTEGKPQLLGLALNLHFEKICMFLVVKKYGQANEILNNENVHSGIYAKTADHLIRAARNIGETADYKKAHAYLKDVTLNLKFDKDFQTIIAQAIQYFDSRKDYRGLNLPRPARTSLVGALDALIKNLEKRLPHLEPMFQQDRAIVLIHRGKIPDAVSVLKKQKDTSFYRIIRYFTERVKTSIESKAYEDAKRQLMNMANIDALMGRNPLKIEDHVAVYVVGKALMLLKTQRFEEALNYLTDVSALDFQHKILISKYKDYVELCKIHKNTTATKEAEVNRFIEAIDSIITQTPQAEIFNPIQMVLKHEKLLACMVGKKYDEVKMILGDQNTDLTDSATIWITFKIASLIAERKYNDALAYIDEVNQLALKDNELIIKHREYITCWKEQNGELPKQEPQARKFIDSIDALLNLMTPISQSEYQANQLKYEKLLTCLEIEDLATGREIVKQKSFTNQMRSALVLNIISKAEIRRARMGTDKSLRYLDTVVNAFDLSEVPLIRKYIKFLKDTEDIDEIHSPDDEEFFLKIIRLIDSLIDDFGNAQCPASFKATQADLLVHLGYFNLKNQKIVEALSFYENARKIMPTNHQGALRELENIILQLKEKSNNKTNRRGQI